jgi:hypothetical protein
VGPRAGLDGVAKKKINPFLCRESNLGRPARSSVTMLTEVSCVNRYKLLLCKAAKSLGFKLASTCL